jgi:hypothetical protein
VREREREREREIRVEIEFTVGGEVRNAEKWSRE